MKTSLALALFLLNSSVDDNISCIAQLFKTLHCAAKKQYAMSLTNMTRLYTWLTSIACFTGTSGRYFPVLPISGYGCVASSLLDSYQGASVLQLFREIHTGSPESCMPKLQTGLKLTDRLHMVPHE